MRNLARLLLALSLALGCSAPPTPPDPPPQRQDPPADTPLDRYVARKDDSFAWKLQSSSEGAGYKAYVLSLTSQSWRTAAEVDQTEWRHSLTIIRPSQPVGDKAFLYITGGDNDDKPPTMPDSLLTLFATQTGSIVIELRQVPNQPLRFLGEQTARSEDGLIAYTWRKVMETGDPTWSARFPMVKSVVRAMDAAQAFLQMEAGAAPERFVVGGGSKRGWTTWLTGVVDRRVEAIVPLVIDVLNVEASFKHHLAAYGFYAQATQDYVDQGIMSHVGQPEFGALLQIEDPYSYRARLSLPKYVVNATGDQFFLPDSSRFYYDDLPGEKRLRYVPNSEHSLGDTDAAQGVVAYYASILNDRPLPRYSWTLEGEDQIVVRTEDQPLAVSLWQAQNDKARDFRVDTIGKSWKGTALQAESPGVGAQVYRARVPRPAQGHAAFFVELTFPSGEAFPLKFSTQVRVVPDTLPFADRDPRTGQLEKR